MSQEGAKLRRLRKTFIVARVKTPPRKRVIHRKRGKNKPKPMTPPAQMAWLIGRLITVKCRELDELESFFKRDIAEAKARIMQLQQTLFKNPEFVKTLRLSAERNHDQDF
jgi:hypothetical protein